MVGLIIWMFASYAVMLGIGFAFLFEGMVLPGLAIVLTVPLWRVARRFRAQVGYRPIRFTGGAGSG